MCLAQGPQRSDTGEARTCSPSVSSQALYHWATALPNFGWDSVLHKEHFALNHFEFVLAIREILIDDFSIFSSSPHLVLRRRTIWAISEDSNVRNSLREIIFNLGLGFKKRRFCFIPTLSKKCCGYLNHTNLTILLSINDYAISCRT